ncbi:MAG TPA: aspartate aminotransferase family protein [Phycisphaerae bacterium]|nr:aspartate aminotransferase family protein [Phycisphaerae bacterium]
MPKNKELIQRHEKVLIGNYGKLPVAFVRGQGALLWDAEGKQYIDFFAGFGGTILGHCHPALTAAVTRQAQTLWQTGNQFYTEPQIRLAENLVNKSFDGRVFFCHSGAEAMEAAIKLARISGGPERTNVISTHKGFHGRTMGALSATAGPAQNGFAPFLPGFLHVPFNDLKAMDAAIDERTTAVILEPIQGEGGINIPAPDYLAGVRALCDRYGAALILDEVWTGVGRTGKYFGHQHFAVQPDIMTLGKALGGGLPVGAIVANPQRAAFFKPGTHGCTLGGNPICTAAAAAVFDVIEREELTVMAAQNGEMIINSLRSFAAPGNKIKEVRGMGMFIGVEMTAADATPVVLRALQNGLVINVTQKNVLRICPSLVITPQQIQQGLDILFRTIAEV